MSFFGSKSMHRLWTGIDRFKKNNTVKNNSVQFNLLYIFLNLFNYFNTKSKEPLFHIYLYAWDIAQPYTFPPEIWNRKVKGFLISLGFPITLGRGTYWDEQILNHAGLKILKWLCVSHTPHLLYALKVSQAICIN